MAIFKYPTQYTRLPLRFTRWLSKYFIKFLMVYVLSNTPLVYGEAVATTRPAPALQLANVYRRSIDIRQYWVSEKLDGVRAYWDGRHLNTRRGIIINAPDWFTAGFPDMPLDGELWMGRGTFATLSGVVRQKKPQHAKWRRIRYMVFDLPASKAIFDVRLQLMQQLFSTIATPYIKQVKQFKVVDHQTLMQRLQGIVKKGGEGLMLHRGNSHYQALRSDDLLKLKPYTDGEAIVIKHLPGKGKYEGMMGSILVETPSKQRFKIGTGFTDYERANPPPIGSTITYKYVGKTKNGLPRFASFLRIRQKP